MTHSLSWWSARESNSHLLKHVLPLHHTSGTRMRMRVVGGLGSENGSAEVATEAQFDWIVYTYRMMARNGSDRAVATNDHETWIVFD